MESKKEREGSGADDRSGVGLAYFNSVEVSGLVLLKVDDIHDGRRRPQRLW